MAYLFVIAIISLALLFIMSAVASEVVKWLIQKIIDLKDEVTRNPN